MLLFDLDGTLIDSNGIWREVDETFLSRRGMPYTRAYYEGVAHTTFPRAAEFTRAFCHLEESCEEIIAEWMELSKGLYGSVPLKPWVREYLEQCRREGIPMAVVTSSVPEHCRAALDRLELEPFFQGVTFAQTLGLEKRQTELWLAAAASYGVSPGECIAFDDSLAALRGARAAGMRTVGVYDDAFAHDEAALRAFCDRYVRDFSELLKTSPESEKNVSDAKGQGAE